MEYNDDIHRTVVAGSPCLKPDSSAEERVMHHLGHLLGAVYGKEHNKVIAMEGPAAARCVKITIPHVPVVQPPASIGMLHTLNQYAEPKPSVKQRITNLFSRKEAPAYQPIETLPQIKPRNYAADESFVKKALSAILKDTVSPAILRPIRRDDSESWTIEFEDIDQGKLKEETAYVLADNTKTLAHQLERLAGMMNVPVIGSCHIDPVDGGTKSNKDELWLECGSAEGASRMKEWLQAKWLPGLPTSFFYEPVIFNTGNSLIISAYCSPAERGLEKDEAGYELQQKLDKYNDRANTALSTLAQYAGITNAKTSIATAQNQVIWSIEEGSVPADALNKMRERLAHHDLDVQVDEKAQTITLYGSALTLRPVLQEIHEDCIRVKQHENKHNLETIAGKFAAGATAKLDNGYFMIQLPKGASSGTRAKLKALFAASGLPLSEVKQGKNIMLVYGNWAKPKQSNSKDSPALQHIDAEDISPEERQQLDEAVNNGHFLASVDAYRLEEKLDVMLATQERVSKLTAPSPTASATVRI